MARKKKAENELLKPLTLRLPGHAIEELEAKARSSGLTRSDVARRLFLQGEVTIRTIPPANLAQIRELKRLGVLLNQIAKALNTIAMQVDLDREIDTTELRLHLINLRTVAHDLAGLFAGIA